MHSHIDSRHIDSHRDSHVDSPMAHSRVVPHRRPRPATNQEERADPPTRHVAKATPTRRSSPSSVCNHLQAYFFPAASGSQFGASRFRALRWAAWFLLAAVALLPALAALKLQAQQAAPAAASQPSAATPTATPAQPAAAPPHIQPASAPPSAAQPPAIGEDQLRRLLIGKDLFLRGGYLDNTLEFNEHGVLIGHSPQGSYTLCGIRIEKVRLLKHKVELEGARYGLHFLGATPYEDPTLAVDRVNITPKKKAVRITIDRELVVKEKAEKGKKKAAARSRQSAPITAKPAAAAEAKPDQTAANPSPAAAPPVANSVPTAANPAPAPAPPAAVPGPSPTSAPAGEVPTEATNGATSDAAEAQAEIAQAPAAERPADLKSVTTTHSQAHANGLLEDAIGNIFAQGLDARMMAAMPASWKLYYQAAAAKADYRPQDPSVLRQNMVDKKARLITAFAPASNQFAQDYGVAGMAEYHVVVGADGKPGEIAVARPIGFGLDESAVDTIRKATFEPAVKDGQPVPVLLDLIVEFRIYSSRTAVASQPQPGQPPEAPSLPGPYSVQH